MNLLFRKEHRKEIIKHGDSYIDPILFCPECGSADQKIIDADENTTVCECITCKCIHKHTQCEKPTLLSYVAAFGGGLAGIGTFIFGWIKIALSINAMCDHTIEPSSIPAKLIKSGLCVVIGLGVTINSQCLLDKINAANSNTCKNTPTLRINEFNTDE